MHEDPTTVYILAGIMVFFMAFVRDVEKKGADSATLTRQLSSKSAAVNLMKGLYLIAMIAGSAVLLWAGYLTEWLHLGIITILTAPLAWNIFHRLRPRVAPMRTNLIIALSMGVLLCATAIGKECKKETDRRNAAIPSFEERFNQREF